MRHTRPRALRHHPRRHRLLPHLLERRGGRGFLSPALALSDIERPRDVVLVRSRVQLALLRGVPLKRDDVALALQLLRETHALGVEVRVHRDVAAGGGARSGREPARAAIVVPLVVVAQADLVGPLEIIGVLLQERVDLRVAQRHPEPIARDVRLGDLTSEVRGAVGVDVETKIGPAEGVVHEAVHAAAQLSRTREAVVGLDPELLERRRYVDIASVLQSQSLLLEYKPVEVARVVLHRVQLRRREHGHRAWAPQI